MPLQRKQVLLHVIKDLMSKMSRTKKIPDDNAMDTPLDRCLSTFDLTLLGVGHMMGAGIYILTGTVARDLAGPAIVVSFMLASMASLMSALCYAEFGTRVPRAGSAYVYTYCSVGEFWAFVIGWNIILEHMIGAATVARAWSGYMDSMTGGAISSFSTSLFGETNSAWLGTHPDFLAFLLCLAFAAIIGLEVKATLRVNHVFTIITICVLTIVISVGFFFAKTENWTNDFVPFGWSGILEGAAACFYAFVGFDVIASAGEEARNPAVSIPVATVWSMVGVTFGYIFVGSALTLMVPYSEIDPAAALPAAFDNHAFPWLKYVVAVGALCGMSASLVGSLFALPRTMYAMANDGLLFKFLGKVNQSTKVSLYIGMTTHIYVYTWIDITIRKMHAGRISNEICHAVAKYGR